MPNLGAQPSTKQALFLLLTIFSCSVLCLGLVYYNFPKLDASERSHIKLPKSIEDVKRLGNVLSQYKDKYFFTVLSGFLVTYVL